jgi:hypothetical protein
VPEVIFFSIRPKDPLDDGATAREISDGSQLL